MAVTKLDPKTALLVIDLQKGIMSLPTAHPTDQVVKRARQMIDAALTRLTAPDQMGELFKVLAIADPTLGALPGFEPPT